MIWKVQRVDEKIIFKQFLKITFFRTAQRRFFSVTPTEDAAFFQGESLGSPTKSHFTSIHPVSARAIFSRANRSTFSHALKFERARKKAERRCFLCTRPKVLLRRLWWRNEISIDRKVDHLSPQKILRCTLPFFRGCFVSGRGRALPLRQRPPFSCSISSEVTFFSLKLQYGRSSKYFKSL